MSRLDARRIARSASLGRTDDSRPARFRNHGSIRQRNPAGQPRRGDAPLLPRLRDERDRRAGAARCARRAEAGAPARAVRHARGQQRLEPALREVRPRRRRGARQVPPARRFRDLRSPGAHGAGLLHALHADRRPGQLRLGRRRRPGGLPLYRVPAGSASPSEMLADIDKETVDFVPNYDGKEQEPTRPADAGSRTC